MLQSTSSMEFAGARDLPAAGWIQQQSTEGMLPALEGTCVVVIGADPTTAPGQRVKRFWFDYFDAAGASLADANYRLRAPVDEISC